MVAGLTAQTSLQAAIGEVPGVHLLILNATSTPELAALALVTAVGVDLHAEELILWRDARGRCTSVQVPMSSA
jgi:hypothetical protein